MLNIILHIYFCLNIFLFGMEFGRSDYRREEGQITLYIWIFLILFFGVLIYGYMFASEGVIALFNYLDRIFQIKFFFQFNFSKYYNDKDLESLTRINKMANKKDDSTYKHRRFKRCVQKINKRNKFIYVPAPNLTGHTEF